MLIFSLTLHEPNILYTCLSFIFIILYLCREYERTAAEALFSTCHCTVGVVFIGTAVIYIAQEVGKNQDDWLIQMMKKKELALAAETEGYKDDIIAFFTYYLPKLKIFIVFLGWFVMGIVWYVFTLPTSSSSNGWQLIDFVLSTLSGGGYLAIETNSNRSLLYTIPLCIHSPCFYP